MTSPRRSAILGMMAPAATNYKKAKFRLVWCISLKTNNGSYRWNFFESVLSLNNLATTVCNIKLQNTTIKITSKKKESKKVQKKIVTKTPATASYHWPWGIHTSLTANPVAPAACTIYTKQRKTLNQQTTNKQTNKQQQQHTGATIIDAPK
jgi:hypothetical protein